MRKSIFLIVLGCLLVPLVISCGNRAKDGDILLTMPPVKYEVQYYYGAPNHVKTLYCDKFSMDSGLTQINGYWEWKYAYGRNCYIFRDKEIWVEAIKITEQPR